MHENTISRRIFEYIQAHPDGVTRMEIIQDLELTNRPIIVRGMIAQLRRGNAIENRGGRAVYARWYPIDAPPINQFYANLAEDLLGELQKTHHLVRSEYLAQRLQEVFEEKSPVR